jgi:hypothetical protein
MTDPNLVDVMTEIYEVKMLAVTLFLITMSFLVAIAWHIPTEKKR